MRRVQTQAECDVEAEIHAETVESTYCRAIAIERAVRDALRELSATERAIIEGYYFDGHSLGQLARSRGVPFDLVRITRRRALAKLEQMLRPFVEKMFGLAAVRHPDCPICKASWRTIAEDILDARTSDVTWGEITTRIKRAVGWEAPSPQVLITHQRKHRRSEKQTTTQPKGDLA